MGELNGPRAEPLLVFADDWGRHPSSCQHLARHLLHRHKVLWVNTIGTRPPGWDLATLRRTIETLRRWGRGGVGCGHDELPDNLQVLSPKMWPWFRSDVDRRLNLALLLQQLGPALKSLSSPPVAVTTLPIIADLIGPLPVARWLYYCVDDFSQWPGLDQAALARMEELLVRRADALVAVSEVLRGRLAAMGRESFLLTHGVNLAHWSGLDRTPDTILPLDGLQRPLIVFWGVIDRRLDVRLLTQLAADLHEGTILLVGPEQDPDPVLAAIPRLVRRPSLPYDQLPQLAHEAAVLIMPYADLPVTRAMQPLKLKEYLATGRPAVVAALPATRDWSDCLDVVSGPQAFSAAVRLRLDSGLPRPQAASRSHRLEGEGWAAKAAIFERLAIGNDFLPVASCKEVPR